MQSSTANASNGSCLMHVTTNIHLVFAATLLDVELQTLSLPLFALPGSCASHFEQGTVLVARAK